MPTIYTIGFQDFTIDDFINLLKQKGITLLIDIRSKPYSDRFPDYNKDNLKATLASYGIAHESSSREFGARQEDPTFYTDGQLDFELFGNSPMFIEGVERVIGLIDSGETVVLMCHESDPIDCHRAILCGRAFHNRGFQVIHLLAHDSAISQEVIEKRLLAKHFPDAENQPDDKKSRKLLSQAYRKQNAIIGFRKS